MVVHVRVPEELTVPRTESRMAAVGYVITPVDKFTCSAGATPPS